MLIYFTAIFWNFKKVFTQKKWGQIFVGFAYITILFLLFFFIYFLGKESFRFLHNFKEVSKPIVEYILLSSLAFATLVSVLSFTVVLSQRLFDRKLTLFFISPACPISVFQAVYWENFVIGSWPFLILALPLLIAYLDINNAAVNLYFFTIILLFILSVLTESLGALLAFVSRYFFGKASPRLLYIFSFLIFLALFFFLKSVFLPQELKEIAERPTLKEVFTGLSSLPITNRNLPPALFLNSLSLNIVSFLIFFAQAFLLYVTSLIIAGRIYRTTWQKAQEGSFLAIPNQNVTNPKKAANFHGVLSSLIKRETLLMDRSLSFLLYYGFVIFLAFVFFFLLSKSPRSPDFSPTLFPKIASLTIMIIGYLTSMVALRFSFPSLVLEYRAFWSFSRLPLAKKRILLVKWGIQTLLPVMTFWLLGISAFLVLRLPLDFLTPIILLCLSCSFLISTIYLFAGTVFSPQLPRENIDQITTTLPAVISTLACILVSFLYGVFFLGLVGMHNDGGIILISAGGQSMLLAFLLIFSIIIWVWSFNFGLKKFNQMDIR